MSDTPENQLAKAIAEGARDLVDAADRMKLPYIAVCNALNEGLLNGHFKIQVIAPEVKAAGK